MHVADSGIFTANQRHGSEAWFPPRCHGPGCKSQDDAAQAKPASRPQGLGIPEQRVIRQLTATILSFRQLCRQTRQLRDSNDFRFGGATDAHALQHAIRHRF